MPLLQLPLTYAIATSRCRLRAPTAEDIPYVFSATRHPGFNDGMLWDPPETPAELEAPLAQSLKAWAKGEAYSFTIDRCPDHVFLGRISIRPAVAGVECWNIGFWLHPAHQGCGYMREAAGAVLQFGFEHLKAREIGACHATWNQASEHVLRSIGMTFVEHVPHGFQKRGQWVAENRMAISRAGWSSRAAGA
ncbi:MAG TPA: GNAT family N-acetyltransferase [Tepidisphaeraceae bacterium]|jgi:ribosomal-protein-alanine N-acetyltransferase